MCEYILAFENILFLYKIFCIFVYSYLYNIEQIKILILLNQKIAKLIN
jgi:hypothetical protein